jgi:methionyl-tRNA formyltransferase
MVKALDALERKTLRIKQQPAEGVTYAAKIDKGETRVDWTGSWKAVHDHCRGLSPFPGAWFEFADSVRVKVLRTTRGDGSGMPGTVLDDGLTIACGEGAVRLTLVQRAGRQPMTAEDFLRGTPVAPGTRVS